MAETQGSTRGHWMGVRESFLEKVVPELSHKGLFGDSQVKKGG